MPLKSGNDLYSGSVAVLIPPIFYKSRSQVVNLLSLDNRSGLLIITMFSSSVCYFNLCFRPPRAQIIASTASTKTLTPGVRSSRPRCRCDQKLKNRSVSTFHVLTKMLWNITYYTKNIKKTSKKLHYGITLHALGTSWYI